MADDLTVRAREIVGAARAMLESEGPEALTMRRLADRLGIRAPSLYKHFPHKAALEVAIIIDGFEEAAAAFEAAELEATGGAADLLQAFVAAYRAFAKSHPHVYRLMTERPLPREQLPRRIGSSHRRSPAPRHRRPSSCPSNLGVHPRPEPARAQRPTSR